MSTDELTPTQCRFIKWLAAQKGKTETEISERYHVSLTSYPGGHSGTAYRQFCDLNYATFQLFHGDAIDELETTYEFYGELHFLRMLSYPDPSGSLVQFICSCLDLNSVTILDYGCGLAQLSKEVAAQLHVRQTRTRLHLADIRTCRESFLKWDAANFSYETNFIRCLGHAPASPLPICNLIIATEVLEHTYEPVRFLRAFNDALLPGGILVTNVEPHAKEFMHVSPDLDDTATELTTFGYKEVQRYVWRKPLTNGKS